MKHILFVALTFMVVWSCSKKDSTQGSLNCDKLTLVSDALFENAPRDMFQLDSAYVNDDCLKVTVSYGGGCGGAIFELIATTSILESDPVQRIIRISLDDKDDCEAYITEEISFDLIPLRVDSITEINLNLAGLASALNYQY